MSLTKDELWVRSLIFNYQITKLPNYQILNQDATACITECHGYFRKSYLL